MSLEKKFSPKHIKTVHEGEKTHECSKCNSKFVAITSLDEHVLAIHERKRQVCATCKASFSFRSTLMTHISTIHGGKRKPFGCDICNFRALDRFNVKQHISSVHEGKRPYSCNICEATFKTRQSFTGHTKNFHEKENEEMP